MNFDEDGISVSEFDNLDGDTWRGIVEDPDVNGNEVSSYYICLPRTCTLTSLVQIQVDDDPNANVEILDLIRRQMNIKPVDAPDVRNPLLNDENSEQELWDRIRAYQDNGYIPDALGLEAGGNDYGNRFEELQLLPIGSRKRGKCLRLILNEAVWKPRVVLWAQSLEAMHHVLAS